MRNLFFALVLTNLAFAAWTAWYAEPPRVSARASEGGVSIRLVGEADAEPAAADAAEAWASGRADRISKLPEGQPDERFESIAPSRSSDSPGSSAGDESSGSAAPSGSSAASAPASASASAAAPPADGLRCFGIGPFTEPADAEAVAAALEAAGHTPSPRSEDAEIWVGFWVHIDRIPTREEANAMLTRLRENGVPEAYLIPGEEDGDIISLGVFNNMTRAGRLEEEVRQIGLEPVIVERSRPGRVHWVDVAAPAGGEIDFAALGIEADRIEQRACAEPG